MPGQKSKTEITVYYDGDCPICSREINYLKTKNPSCIQFQDICDNNFKSEEIGISYQQLDQYIHAKTADGQILTGMEVFRTIYQRTNLGWLLAPTAWPGVKQIFDLLYYLFAKNRHSISKLVAKLLNWK